MKKFIKNLSIFLSILIVVSLLFGLLDIFAIGNQYSQGYTAAMIDKLDRLKSIDDPKIVIIGDSNLAFGINSKILEEALQMPVVNLGLHGGIGDAYYEALAKPYINEGDIVIIAPYTLTGDETFPNKSLAMTMLEKNEDMWESISNNDKLDLLKAYPYYCYSCVTKWVTFSGNKADDTSYSRDAFNEYGDIVKRPEAYDKSSQSLFGYEGVIMVPKYNQAFFDRVNEYNDYVTTRGATLLFAAYPVADCKYTPDDEVYDELENALRENLRCPIISEYESYLFPEDYFYDTVLHLTKEGAEARTTQLVKDIEHYLNNKK